MALQESSIFLKQMLDPHCVSCLWLSTNTWKQTAPLQKTDLWKKLHWLLRLVDFTWIIFNILKRLM
ncbi:hypothetical protein E2C01_101510 [Portunus trituberculatus]|uniref:Uncharacterized protein n=1 Tax=Portunus trituberculatus TaxID=210409 RepID=A0A5B7KK82_PORTR|nr:hypothetical protein [Portunus trituberculatus]